MKQRERNIVIAFRVSEREKAKIEQRFSLAKIKNKEAAYRKLVLNGYIIKTDYADLKSVATELRRIGVNVNQIAHVANTYGAGTLIHTDLQQIQQELDEIWRQLTTTLSPAARGNP